MKWRWGIAARLSAVLAAVSVLVASLTGLYAYQASRDLLVQAAQDELVTAAQVVRSRVTEVRQDAARSLMLIARHPASLALLQGGQTAAAQADHLATLFELLMAGYPDYFQVRLISAAEHGLERVRIDRDGDQLLRVQGDELQEKSHYAYVSDALKLPAGSIYLSNIGINHERGAHAGLGQPTVLLAAPVADASGKALGVVVINIDLNGVFARLSADLPPDFQLYLANQHGDFLIHPDSSRAFAFDRGRRVLMQDEFAPTQALVGGQVNQLVFEVSDATYTQTPMVAAFVSHPVKIQNTDAALFLGLALPRSSVLARSNQLGRTILQIAGGFGLAGFALALLLARRLTHPLNTMSRAVAGFSTEQPISGLPVARQDELGQLARSFDHMQVQIRQQFAELQARRQELEHLARHDALTGLPNRRLFLERLDQAIARARRAQTTLAVIFIDVDRFKQINDQRGHEAGDDALQWVARQLLANTRQTDTVARLGGDEFVVLLDGLTPSDPVNLLAQKLADNLHQPWTYQGHTAHIALSLGLSLYPRDGETPDQLLASADHAMYRAKTNGGNALDLAEAAKA